MLLVCAASSRSTSRRSGQECQHAKRRKILKDLLRDRVDLQDVFRSRELFLVITQFQPGCTRDLKPFSKFKQRNLDKIAFLVPHLDVIHQTLTPWYEMNGHTRLGTMFQCLEYMPPIVVLDALAHGKIDVLCYLHTHWRWALDSAIRNEAGDAIPIMNV
ncbi:unnamed protein product [Aphanomyces euteiches]